MESIGQGLIEYCRPSFDGLLVGSADKKQLRLLVVLTVEFRPHGISDTFRWRQIPPAQEVENPKKRTNINDESQKKRKKHSIRNPIFFSLMALNRMWLNDLIGPARRWRQIQFRIDDYVSKSIELESINVS